jgi:hypothetical protein
MHVSHPCRRPDPQAVFDKAGAGNGLRQVFASPGTGGGSGSLALASNGNWVVGVWTDELTATAGRVVPWIAYNVRSLVYLPLTLRN